MHAAETRYQQARLCMRTLMRPEASAQQLWLMYARCAEFSHARTRPNMMMSSIAPAQAAWYSRI